DRGEPLHARRPEADDFRRGVAAVAASRFRAWGGVWEGERGVVRQDFRKAQAVKRNKPLRRTPMKRRPPKPKAWEDRELRREYLMEHDLCQLYGLMRREHPRLFVAAMGGWRKETELP